MPTLHPVQPAGQSLVEFTVSVLLLSIFLGAGGLVLKAQWERARCAYIIFEKAHQRLIQGAKSDGHARGNYGVQVRGVCGGAEERVDLPWLESAQW